MSSNDLSDKESTVSFARTDSDEKTPPVSQPRLTINDDINQDRPKQESTMPKRYPVPEDLPYPHQSQVDQNEPTVSIHELPHKQSRIQLNSHKMICCPPKKGIVALGQAFGLTGALNMMLWQENFYQRVMENEVGFCVRNACICCLPLCNKTTNKQNKNKSEKESLEDGDSDDNEQEKENDDYMAKKEDGMEYYHYLSKLEMRMPRHAGIRKKTSPRPNYVLSVIRAKEKELENLPEEERKKGMEELERELVQKHHHNPWFIIVISIIQLIALIISLIMGGFALTGVEPKIELVKGVTTFRGLETYDIWHRPNIWIGPPLGELISYGAIYAPCMRTDEVVTVILLSQPHGEKGEIGCCVVKKHDIAGTTTSKECHHLTMGGGAWFNQPCSKVKPQVATILKPCCFGYLGTCKLSTKKGCEAHEGHYFADSKEHCSEVFCFSHFCGNFRIDADKEWHFMPGMINQSWRYFASLFFHAGILHFVIVFIVQWCAGRPIEAAVGHTRITLVYVSGTIGGNLVGSFFDPYLPQVGCSGGVFSLLGISVIECLQALHFRKKKYFSELFFVILVMLFLVIAGFFPFVNNFAHFGGLLFGIPMAFATMPHLCFNRWSCKARWIIFIISFITLILFIVVFVVLFYIIQDMGFCRYCYYFSCLPYTENVCNVLVELQGTLSHD